MQFIEPDSIEDIEEKWAPVLNFTKNGKQNDESRIANAIILESEEKWIIPKYKRLLYKLKNFLRRLSNGTSSI